MPEFLTIPDSDCYWLRNGRVPAPLLNPEVALIPGRHLVGASSQEELVPVDIEIRGGAIGRIVAAGDSAALDAYIDLDQGLVWPCFVDMHTHLDKGHVWPRRPNPDGSFSAALEAVGQDHDCWTPEELYHRMEFGLRCSYAHGTRALRTHLDCFAPLAQTSFEVFDQLRRRWANRISLQAVCLVSLDYFLTADGDTLAALVAEFGGVLGGVAYMNPDLDRQLDRVFTLAQRYGLDLDFHTDESLNPEDITLRHVAAAALRHGFTGQITCGHCCSLSVQSPETIESTLKLVAAAPIGIVSLPLCNLYLQHRRGGQTPRYRGVTLLQELHRRGIPAAIASDNCRDPFYAYGDHDGLEVFEQAVRIGHLDHLFDHWPRSITSRPARLMGLDPAAALIGPGASADLICFQARSLNELLSRSQHNRVVIRQGRQIDTTLPDYRELDRWL